MLGHSGARREYRKMVAEKTRSYIRLGSVQVKYLLMEAERTLPYCASAGFPKRFSRCGRTVGGTS